MLKEYEIVPAGPDKADDVMRITQTVIKSVYPRYYPAGAVQFFSDHHSPERVAEDIAAGLVYILKTEGHPVGTVTVKGCCINRLFVLPEYQRRGFGRALLDLAENIISKNYPAAEMDVSLPAKSIYLKRGYKETEYHTVETQNGDFLCYDVMVKTFSAAPAQDVIS